VGELSRATIPFSQKEDYYLIAFRNNGWATLYLIIIWQCLTHPEW
jgi:hypothetical protein